MQVVGERTPPAGKQAPSRPAAVLSGAAVVLALALFGLATHQTVSITPADAPSLGERVPGLRSSLLATIGDRRPYRVLRWDPDQAAPGSSLLPVGSGLPGFDASGRWMASLVEDGSASHRLWVGEPGGDMSPVAGRVTSFTWHEGDPSRLAWTVTRQGRHAILLGRAAPDGIRVSSVLSAPAGRLEAWGDRGFVLAVGDPPSLVLLDPEARTSRHLDARFLALRPDGWALLGLPDRLALLDPSRGADAALPWAPHPALAAAWSPEGGRLALVIGGDTPELRVYEPAGELLVRRPVPTLARPEWAPDGRFVALAVPELPPHGARRPVLFLDLEDGSLETVRFGGPVQAALLR